MTPIYLAVSKENIEIIKLLLSNDKVDPNLVCILNSLFSNKILKNQLF